MADVIRRVLYVDDDRNLLEAVRRQQRKHFDLTLCDAPAEAIERLRDDGPFSVIVSDLRMPDIDGIELLRRVREIDPDTTRIMLTGNADLEAAKRAVNDGHIFRFLTKPCEPGILRDAIYAGQRIYELVVGERELLERTLQGSIEVLTDVLALVNPAAFGRASRVRRTVSGIVEQLGLADAWRFEVAGMLSQIGCVTIPPLVIEDVAAGRSVSEESLDMLRAHPRVGAQLLQSIPRLEEVAEMIAHQDASYSPTKESRGALHGEDLPIGARILRVALDFDLEANRVESPIDAVATLKAREGSYDPGVLDALEIVARLASEQTGAAVSLVGLQVGMIIAESVYTTSGLLLIAAGQNVTVSILKHLHNRMRSQTDPVVEPIHVLIPATPPGGLDTRG